MKPASILMMEWELGIPSRHPCEFNKIKNNNEKFFKKHNDNNSNKKNLRIQQVSASLSIRGKKCPLEVGMPDITNKIRGHEVKLEV